MSLFAITNTLQPFSYGSLKKSKYNQKMDAVVVDTCCVWLVLILS
jgi:hypothetical protein